MTLGTTCDVFHCILGRRGIAEIVYTNTDLVTYLNDVLNDDEMTDFTKCAITLAKRMIDQTYVS